MSDTRKQTIARYYSLLQTNALASAMRAARKHGFIDILRRGQKTCQDLAREAGTNEQATADVLRMLVAIGALEQYGEDFALSQATRLLVGYDEQMGDERLSGLDDYLRVSDGQGSGGTTGEIQGVRQVLVSRQWTQTAAAVQAAEVLDIGHSRRGLKILELGGGAGVWSAAICYRDSTTSVTFVDDASSIALARQTYSAVEIEDRVTWVEADYRSWDAPLGSYDMVLLPEVLQLESDSDGVILLGRALDALRAGGEVVILEPLLEPDGPELAIAAHALEIGLGTMAGRLRTASQVQQLLRGAGFGEAQWGWLTATTQGCSLVIAQRTN